MDAENARSRVAGHCGGDPHRAGSVDKELLASQTFPRRDRQRSLSVVVGEAA